MKFYLKQDEIRRRSYRKYGRIPPVKFTKINHAIDELKKKERPHRLVFQDDDSSGWNTLMFFEGVLGQGSFTEKKLSTLIKVGAYMYVPKSLVRKTTRKRKRKCKKSKNSTVIEDSVRFTRQDSNSPL
jgi:hypothetical protein